MTEQPQSRRSFLYSAVASGISAKAAFASRIRVVERQERDFVYEGYPATEFIVRPHQLETLGPGAGGAIELIDPAAGESYLAPLFDLTVLGEDKFEQGLKASVLAHGSWHQEQNRSAPPIHIHLIRVADHPHLRALLVHPRRCVIAQRPA